MSLRVRLWYEHKQEYMMVESFITKHGHSNSHSFRLVSMCLNTKKHPRKAIAKASGSSSPPSSTLTPPSSNLDWNVRTDYGLCPKNMMVRAAQKILPDHGARKFACHTQPPNVRRRASLPALWLQRHCNDTSLPYFVGSCTPGMYTLWEWSFAEGCRSPKKSKFH